MTANTSTMTCDHFVDVTVNFEPHRLQRHQQVDAEYVCQLAGEPDGRSAIALTHDGGLLLALHQTEKLHTRILVQDGMRFLTNARHDVDRFLQPYLEGVEQRELLAAQQAETLAWCRHCMEQD